MESAYPYDIPAREVLGVQSPQSPGTPQTCQSMSLTSPSTLSTPGSTPPVCNTDSRMKRFGHKLAFWKRRKTTAADVQMELEKLGKAHEKYEARLRMANDCIRFWTEYLNPPNHVTKDALQAQLSDEFLSRWTCSMLDALKPVLEIQAQQGLLISTFAHSFQALKDEEACCREIIYKLAGAEKRYYKALAANKPTMASAEFDRERRLLQGQLDGSRARFRAVARQELPQRFKQLVCYMQNICSVVRPAQEEISRLIPKDTDFSGSGLSPQSSFYLQSRRSSAPPLSARTSDSHTPPSDESPPFAERQRFPPSLSTMYSGRQALRGLQAGSCVASLGAQAPGYVDGNADIKPLRRSSASNLNGVSRGEPSEELDDRDDEYLRSGPSHSPWE